MVNAPLAIYCIESIIKRIQAVFIHTKSTASLPKTLNVSIPVGVYFGNVVSPPSHFFLVGIHHNWWFS